MSNLLEVKDLFVQYNTDSGVVHALNGLNFSLEAGETVGLVGETGAGKTTLALSILKLLPKNVGEIKKGSISYDGKDLINFSNEEMQEIRGRKISMIFQDPMSSLNPTKTVGVQIMEVLDLHFKELSLAEKKKKVDNILTLVGIPPARQGEFPFQFSGGMKQRIIIAMALIAEPELILADEPTTALDVTIQAQILELIRKLKSEFNTAMLLITHDLGIVVEICSKIAVIYSGEIFEIGKIEDIYVRKENHPYTEGLFKCIPDLTTNARRLTPIIGSMPNPEDLPKGCKFYERCIYKKDICAEKEPDYYTKGTHTIKCFLYKDKWGE
ncbi:ABC transporter ATP-binding protein [Breznakiella homolactica]|uniref:ABC transporter ATP-binding protein n=1 Tax=Breznakiella homolactica TaxID=2798577 RepID=A0A7T7XMA0_9SPIR|nr:ABC transporter ATP-binding protein [Breznakiella homolactica]QQO08827.1 ABC transporter ATP-binding protein [Breznakiella homolactica]